MNQFIEDNHKYFYPLEDPDDYRFDVGDEHELVADANAYTLIKLVKFLRRGKSLGPNTMHNKALRLSTTTSLFHHLARLRTSSIQLGYIPTAWKIATLHIVYNNKGKMFTRLIALKIKAMLGMLHWGTNNNNNNNNRNVVVS